MMTFGTGYGSGVDTLTQVPIALDAPGGTELEVQILEATGDGTVTCYLGANQDVASAYLRLPVIATEPTQRAVRRLKPTQPLYVYADLASDKRCTVLFRLYPER